MKNCTKLIFLTLLIFHISSCRSQDCDKLPTTFTSYKEAENFVEKSSFKFKDNVNTSKSSWIKGARFYSCNNQSGFFILETDKENYIYQNLPIRIWTDFKNSKSFGTYYNQFIKNKYQLILTK